MQALQKALYNMCTFKSDTKCYIKPQERHNIYTFVFLLVRRCAFSLVIVQLVKKLGSTMNFLFVRFLVPKKESNNADEMEKKSVSETANYFFFLRRRM